MRAQQLGVQIHCLRAQIRDGLPAVLAQVVARNLKAVELVSFPGCRGNPWGDFGMVADLPPAEIREALDTAGLTCPSAHVAPFELEGARLEQTLTWCKGVGTQRVVLSGLSRHPAQGVDTHLREIDDLNRMGETLAREGFQFALHTQPDLWQVIDGVCVADELPRRLDPALCLIEFDPTGAILEGADPVAYLENSPGRFHAVHLRDGVRPVTRVPHLPALPLGRGSLPVADLVGAAQRSGVPWYFIEMEVSQVDLTWRAIDESHDYLRSAGLLNESHV
jgi:sugar phosphate isomerase/epimerase